MNSSTLVNKLMIFAIGFFSANILINNTMIIVTFFSYYKPLWAALLGEEKGRQCPLNNEKNKWANMILSYSINEKVPSERLIVLKVTVIRNNYWDLLHEYATRNKFIFYRLNYFISLTVFQDSVGSAVLRFSSSSWKDERFRRRKSSATVHV